MISEFWLNNPKILINLFNNINNHTDFKLDFINKLNYIFLLSIIITIILILFNKFNLSYILLSIIIGFLTIIIYNQYIKNIKENYNNKCIYTSINNPFMNPNILYPNNIPPCDLNNNIINEYFFKNIFRDANDLYDRGLSIRQFYTIPGKTIPNDQYNFAQWLYNSNNNKKSCKEGNSSKCIENLNLDRTDLDKVGGGGIGMYNIQQSLGNIA
jgi:hypothetical protein